MAEFIFQPVEGLNNKSYFPTNPVSEEEARQQFMTLFNQIKDHMNNNIKVNSGVKGDSWWIKDEATGLIRQGGIATIPFSNSLSGSVTVNYPIPFPTKEITTVAVERNNNMTTRGMFNIACIPIGNSSFTAQSCVLNEINRTGNVIVSWEATGY